MVASIYDANGDLIEDIAGLPNATILGRRAITPMNYGVIYYRGMLQLYRPHNVVNETIDSITLDVPNQISWKNLVDTLGGNLQNGVSEVRLDQPNGSTVVGTISYHPTDQSRLIFSPIGDTVPSNTELPVNAIIDPFDIPVDSTFINAVPGVRYLILSDIGDVSNVEAAQAWHGSDGSDLVAKANDIIEYDGTRWFVAFAAAGQESVKYLTNLKTGMQFKWVPEDEQWTKSVEGTYQAGEWTIVIALSTTP